MKLGAIDNLAWLVIRVIMLVQFVMVSVWYQLFPPDKTGDKIEAMGRIYGSWHVYETPREELPEIVTDKLLPIGRAIMAAGIFAILVANIMNSIG